MGQSAPTSFCEKDGAPWSETDYRVLRYDAPTGTLVDTFVSSGDVRGPTVLMFIPEPATLILLTVGGLFLGRRRPRSLQPQ